MKNKGLSELTIQELQDMKKKLRGTTIGFVIVMTIACAVLLYLAITNKNYALITVAIGCYITLLPSFINLGQVNTELKSRTSK